MEKLLETEDGCLWIENYISHLLDGVFIHWDVYKWTPSKVKYYKDLWNNFIVLRLKSKWKNIYALPPSPREEKLIKMFGFIDTGLTMRGNKLLIYMPRNN